ncbi:alpha beta hydrolase fold family [Pseudovirgaria hyperparasitica]|uniref:Alpha beta hydrolase fold family n=1 Tax=Pseudovirgaria hyperparasitica TaxID=470096 RepID=A0A6A6W285_9PEZI|nr:alpha beta hydrolase fold family [Pseudovirgaria hyperparasitica]KAF2756060.1 alpha beta hydrolase fold family [Pseudovirgaria hyperparasitica]
MRPVTLYPRLRCGICQLKAQPRRSFTTSPLLRELDLAYDYYSPPTEEEANRNAPILFLHGLFGSKKNNRSMSKVLARDLKRPVYALDLRNHGDSPHHPLHTYSALASDVEHFIRTHSLTNSTLIGHSMGAKTAMAVALRSSDLVANLISVDNAPVDATLKSYFHQYVRGMQRIEAIGVTSQKEADAILAEYEKNEAIRLFLLTNLVRTKGEREMRFRVPLKILAGALDELGSFPFVDPDKVRYEKPALFVRGTKSHYIPDDVIPIVGRFFPKFSLADVEAGHWVISENPEPFKEAVEEFLLDADEKD